MSIGSIVAFARKTEDQPLKTWRELNAVIKRVQLALAEKKLAIHRLAKGLAPSEECEDDDAYLSRLLDEAMGLRRRLLSLLECKLMWTATHGGKHAAPSAEARQPTDHHRRAAPARQKKQRSRRLGSGR